MLATLISLLTPLQLPSGHFIHHCLLLSTFNLSAPVQVFSWIQSSHLQDFFKVLLLINRNYVDLGSCGAGGSQTFTHLCPVTDVFHVKVFLMKCSCVLCLQFSTITFCCVPSG